MKWSFPILRIFGIELRLHATFLLLLAWIGASHGSSDGWKGAFGGVLSVLLIFSCVVLHELGHALAARRFGIKTPDITLLPIGGVAHLERIPERPREELTVAVAGPIVSGLLALMFWAFSGFSSLEPPILDAGLFETILPRLASINLGLLVFNLLPAFPMDGGRMLRAALTERLGRTRATQMAARVGQGLAVLMGFSGLLLSSPILILISVFIFFSARNEAALSEIRSASESLRVGDVMITQFSSLDPSENLGQAAAVLQHSAQQDLPLVSANGQVFGLLSRKALLEGLQESGVDAPAAGYATIGLPRILPSDSLPAAFGAMQSAQKSSLPVVGFSGQIVGILSLEKIGEALLLESAKHSRA
jgi:Zn-dependent protease/predicted transcriptional regulator